MRCPDCNRFVSYEEEEPSLEEGPGSDREEANAQNSTVTVTASVRRALLCDQCSQELKEVCFDLEGGFEVPKEHWGHELEVNHADPENTFRQTQAKLARYRKTFYGVELAVTVRCVQCKVDIGELTLADEAQASGMDELV